MVIQAKYERAGEFRGGLAKVYLDPEPPVEGREQYIDRTGNLIWDFEENK